MMFFFKNGFARFLPRLKRWRVFAFFLFIFCSSIFVAQNQQSKWYFSYNAGLDFMTNPPTILTGTINTFANGSSSASDVNGNLLFYSEGLTVFNQNHAVMANGSGLLGMGCQNACLIAKQPGNANVYYLFTNSPHSGLGGNNSGLRYSIVDMSLAAGLGSVTVKNSPIITPTNLQLTGTKHCNGVDIWIVSHDYGNNTFRSYLLTAVGLNTVPIVSSVGNISSNYSPGAGLDISPIGKKIASVSDSSRLQLFDFDNATGLISNPLTISNPIFNVSLSFCVFSPNGSKLYNTKVTSQNIIEQWDICAASNAAIIASRTTIFSENIINANLMQSLKRGINGKIYIARNNQQILGVINSPNVLGLGCNYVHNGQSIAPNTCGYSLPNFISTFQKPSFPPIVFNANNQACQTASFTSPYALGATFGNCPANAYTLQSLQWDFGDPLSGINNQSTLSSPTHSFSSTGTYTVKLIYNFGCGGGIDTLKQTVIIANSCFSINSTSITCSTLGSATVSPPPNGVPYTYTWVPSAQTGSVAINLNPGSYTLLAFDPNINFTHSTTITFNSLIPLTGNLINSSSITCNGASTGTAGYTGIGGGSAVQNYLYTNGVQTYTNANPTTLSAGIWTSVVTDALTGCQINNIFFIQQPTALNLNISAVSPTACSGSNIALISTLSGGSPGYAYAWSNGSNAANAIASQTLAGTYVYSLIASDSYSCTNTQTVSVNFIPNPVLNIANVYICPLEFGTLSVSGATSYTWSNNSTGSSFTASPVITTQYSLTGSALSCTSVGSAFIIVKSLPNPIISSNNPVCQGGNLIFGCIGGISYVWSGVNSFASLTQNNSINSVNLNQAGVYNVTVTGANSCTASTSVNMTLKPLPTLSITPSSPIICANTNSTTLNAIGTATLFSWQPNQNISSNTAQTITAYPTSTKTYTLTGSLNGCTVQTTATVNVVPPPSLLLSLSSSSVCAQALNGSPNTITLTSSGANSYTLITPNYFTNNNPSGPVSNINLASPFLLTGASTATLYGSNGVCTVSTTAVFTIVPNPSITINSYTPIICVGQTFTYSNSGASSYTWNSTTPGQTLYTTGNVAVASPIISSVFSVFGFSLGCNSALQTSTITVNPIPTLSITPNPASMCLNSPLQLTAYGTGTTFDWYPSVFLNTTHQAQVMVNPPQGPTPTYNYTVISALNNCTNSAVVQVSVMPLPNPSITAITPTLCLNQKLILQGFGGTHYSWLLPNTSTLTSQTLSVMANNSYYSGTYTLVAIDANGCKEQTTTNVKVENLPSGYLSPINMVNACVPFCNTYTFVPANISQANITGFNWQMNNTNISQSNSFEQCFTNGGHYIITGYLSSNIGCINSITLSITAYPKPEADFTFIPEKPVENFDEVIFYPKHNSNNQNQNQNIESFYWLWNDNTQVSGSGQLSSNKQNPSYIFETAGSYPIALMVSNQWQCKDTVIKTITVQPDIAVYVPNAFTPNEDGKNETFNVVTRGIKKCSLFIFNRWGQTIFESNDLNQGWDGTYNGQPITSGAYVWKIQATSLKGDLKEYTGQVMLYR